MPATPLLGWMLTVCCQPAAVYYWNTVVCVCLSPCFLPATPLLGWMLTVCFQLAVVYYWNTVVCVCVSGMLCSGYFSGQVVANFVL